VTTTAPPIGLHFHLVPTPEQSLRVAVWTEVRLDRQAFSQKGGARSGVLEHPCYLKKAIEPPWLPPGSTPLDFVVDLPRFGNGVPVPLPGPIAAWDVASMRTANRIQDRGTYLVSGFALRPEHSLRSLRTFLLSYREAVGEGFLAPQVSGLLRVLAELSALLDEGPLLPTLWHPDARPYGHHDRKTLTPTRPRLGWVPPVSLEQLCGWWTELRSFPSLAAPLFRTDRGLHSALAERYPAHFARFVIDLLAAATAPQKDVALDAALVLKDPQLERLHRSQGSCLYPWHPIFAPPELPPGRLDARVLPAPEGSAQPFGLDLGLVDGDQRLPLRPLLSSPALHHAGVDDGERVWLRPASVLLRDLSLGAARLPWLFCRPELLAQGTTWLTPEDSQRLLAEPLRKAGPDEAPVQAFHEREQLQRKTRAQVHFLSASAGGARDVRVRVRWSLLTPPEGDDGQPLLGGVRFSPDLELLLDEDVLALAEAEELLRGSKAALLKVGDQLVERRLLEDAVLLAQARQKVLAKLGESVSWRQALEAEDSFASERSDSYAEGLFAEAWTRFLHRLERGESVTPLGAPEGFQGTLRPYQARGVTWMAFLLQHGLGGCLADDMGLGKTIQVLAMLEHRRLASLSMAARSKKAPRCTLVVCPTAVVRNWQREAAKFVPRLRVTVHQGPARAATAQALQAQLQESDVLVTSYALLRRDEPLLTGQAWDVLIVDEAQNLKNPATQQSKAARALEASGRLALTGTPVENKLGDLGALYDLLDPGLLGGPTRFARAFASPIRAGDAGALARLRRRLAPVLLRRTKQDPAISVDLPDKQEQDVLVRLTREQRALYVAMAEAATQGLTDKQGMARKAHILTSLLRLKQICNHPEAFAADKPDKLLGRSGKLDRTLELLEELLDEGQAALIFTQFTETGHLLRRALEERFDLDVPFYQGSLSPSAREAMVAAFQAPDGPPVLIVSLRAGGVGLNLTRASAVLHYDRWWNPAVEDQATDRAHRIGQQKKVNVFRLITEGTLEERIAAMLERKRALAGQVLAASDEAWLTELSNAELAKLFTLSDDAEADDA
jgi:superfamily II DNA or RNA helicase